MPRESQKRKNSIQINSCSMKKYKTGRKNEENESPNKCYWKGAFKLRMLASMRHGPVNILVAPDSCLLTQFMIKLYGIPIQILLYGYSKYFMAKRRHSASFRCRSKYIFQPPAGPPPYPRFGIPVPPPPWKWRHTVRVMVQKVAVHVYGCSCIWYGQSATLTILNWVQWSWQWLNY
jgi:hypothetical protein